MAKKKPARDAASRKTGREATKKAEIRAKTPEPTICLPEVIGRGYGTFWRFKGRYRVCKGSRASKKSKTTALWFIVNMMKYPQANALVVRKTFRTLKDSCFTELKWAIHRLGVDAFWEVKESPLEMTYAPTGHMPARVTSEERHSVLIEVAHVD